MRSWLSGNRSLPSLRSAGSLVDASLRFRVPRDAPFSLNAARSHGTEHQRTLIVLWMSDHHKNRLATDRAKLEVLAHVSAIRRDADSWFQPGANWRWSGAGCGNRQAIWGRLSSAFVGVRGALPEERGGENAVRGWDCASGCGANIASARGRVRCDRHIGGLTRSHWLHVAPGHWHPGHSCDGRMCRRASRARQ